MKINRFGKAEVLTPDQINLLFTVGFVKPRDKTLFGVCLYAACRINEACTLPEMYLVAMASDKYCYYVASTQKENETLGRYKFIQLSEDTWRNTIQISVKTICFQGDTG
jgi:hypothetical protein